MTQRQDTTAKRGRLRDPGNLGRAVIELLLEDGWSVAAGAVSDATLAAVNASGALALRADVTDPKSVHRLLTEAANLRRGRPRRQCGFGLRRRPQRAIRRRPHRRADPGGVRRVGGGPGPGCLLLPVASGVPARARTAGDGDPGDGRLLTTRGPLARGLWAAGAFGVRAITQAAALELREAGIHVALLIVDAGIEPFAGGARRHERGGSRRPARARGSRPASSLPPGRTRHHAPTAGDTTRRALGALARERLSDRASAGGGGGAVVGIRVAPEHLLGEHEHAVDVHVEDDACPARFPTNPTSRSHSSRIRAARPAAFGDCA